VPDDSAVSRKVVLAALRAKGVDIAQEEGVGNYTLVKGDRIESVNIPKEVSKRMLQRFQRVYGVPIHWFYNPLMILNEGSQTIQ